MITNRNLLIIIALVAVIGVGLYLRSYYIREDGRYLLAFDPYYHYRMAETIINEGSRPEWDTLASYPTGEPVRHPPLFHYYLAYTYKIVSLFSGMTLFQWCIHANIIPIILSIIAAYYAGKVLTNELGGIFTALFMVVNGSISSRTVLGYTDTDVWIVLFSFAAAYFFFALLKSGKKYWSVFLGLTLFLFALTWRGYWHVHILVFSAFIIYIIVDALKREVDRDLLSAFALSFLSFSLPYALYKGYYITGVVLAVLGVFWIFREKFITQNVKKLEIPIFVVIAGIAAKILYDEGIFSSALGYAGTLLGVASPAREPLILPDISISILQRKVVTLTTISELYSVLPLVAPFGIAFLLWKRTRFSLQTLVYLGLYFLGTAVMLLMGGRYTMMFAVPLVLASGVFFGALPEILKGKVTSKGASAVVLICALSVVPCYVEGSRASKASASMDDDLWELLTWANTNLPEDAVIVSSWDTGYWIESLAKRKSVMNGGHYDITWRVVKQGKLLETTDETIAVKEVYGFDDRSEVEALRTFPETGEWAIQKEMQGFAEDNAYVLVSEWVVLTFYWISYFGTWNYATGEGEGKAINPMWVQDARKLVSATEYIYGDENATFAVIKDDGNFHSFFLDESGDIPTMGTLFLKDGVMHFLKRENDNVGVIYVPPKSMPYFETRREWTDVPSEILVIRREYLECMLTRLYFFNGEDLRYFELVKDCGTAKLYKVHKVPHEFDQGVVTEIDTYQPI